MFLVLTMLNPPWPLVLQQRWRVECNRQCCTLPPLAVPDPPGRVWPWPYACAACTLISPPCRAGSPTEQSCGIVPQGTWITFAAIIQWGGRKSHRRQSTSASASQGHAGRRISSCSAHPGLPWGPGRTGAWRPGSGGGATQRRGSGWVWSCASLCPMTLGGGRGGQQWRQQQHHSLRVAGGIGAWKARIKSMENRSKKTALVHENSMVGNLKWKKDFRPNQDKNPFLEDGSHNWFDNCSIRLTPIDIPVPGYQELFVAPSETIVPYLGLVKKIRVLLGAWFGNDCWPRYFWL